MDMCSASLSDIASAIDAGALDATSLVASCLRRIAAYERQGPSLNALLAVNQQALAEARALDVELGTSGRRSLLHGVPVVLKDNIDTVDLPTTGGSVMLSGSVPRADADLVVRLRRAGAIILAKANMAEFCSGGPFSSMGGPIRNPHSLERSASGSSGGTAVAVAAGYAPVGVGTDTGGSIRLPAAANGVVGFKPTQGLVSLAGVMPLAPTFDTAGPLGRCVADVEALLAVMAGERWNSRARPAQHGLHGARIGIARDFLGQDREVDWIVESSIGAMSRAGAHLLDVNFPRWFLDLREPLYLAIRLREFGPHITGYLRTLVDGHPRSFAELRARAKDVRAVPGTTWTNPGRWALMDREAMSGSLEDAEYLAAKAHGLPMLSEIVLGAFDAAQLDLLIYPTSPWRTEHAEAEAYLAAEDARSNPASIANLIGCPDLSVPAGFTSRGLPVNVSFLGRPGADALVLGIGHAFEQVSQAIRAPIHTPPLGQEGKFNFWSRG